MNRTILSAAVSLALAGAAGAQEIVTAPEAERSGGVVPVTYTGDKGRVGLGIDQDGDLLGEILGVFAYDGTRAFLGEGWFGQGGSGGLKFAYNWLWGGKTLDDTINAPDSVLVSKFFLAADQNVFDDRKATIGFGLEKRNTSWDLYYSRAFTDERLLSSNLDTFTEIVTGVENGRPWRQEITTETLTRLFEHPYEDGIGFRVGHFFEDALLRVRGGLDYERGDALLDDAMPARPVPRSAWKNTSAVPATAWRSTCPTTARTVPSIVPPMAASATTPAPACSGVTTSARRTGRSSPTVKSRSAARSASRRRRPSRRSSATRSRSVARHCSPSTVRC